MKLVFDRDAGRAGGGAPAQHGDGGLVDRARLAHLQAEHGVARFDEMLEDALFEVTERLARIEILIALGDLGATETAARTLAATAEEIGFQSIRDIAETLAERCGERDAIGAPAIARRLVRIGEDSLVVAAELSVDLAIGGG